MCRMALRVHGEVGLLLSVHQLLALVATLLEVAEDVFDQDDGRVDDDAEVQGAHRQQICRIAQQYQDDDAEEERDGYVGADDDRAAQVAQEYPLDQEHQQTSEDEVVQHRVRGDSHQGGAVIKGHHPHARRQGAVVVELVHGGLDPGNHFAGLLRAVHHHDTGDDVVLIVAASLAEPGHGPDRYFCDVP
jgi:hypothetical protein